MPKGKANVSKLKVPQEGKTDPTVQVILAALEPYAEGMARTIGKAGAAKRHGTGWRPGDVRAAQIGLSLLLERTGGSANQLRKMFEALRDTQTDETLPTFQEVTGVNVPPEDGSEPLDFDIEPIPEEEEEEEDGPVSPLFS